jgi:thiol-disulfide isomerase/thioredoxin
MKNMKSRIAIFATVLSLLMLFGCEKPKQLNQGGNRGCQRPKVVAFTASWCGPCSSAKPFLRELQVKGVEVQIIDTDENPEMARQYGVTSVPTFFIYACGKQTVKTQDIAVVVSLTNCGR